MRLRGWLTPAAGLAVTLLPAPRAAEAGLFHRRAEVVYIAPTAYAVPTAPVAVVPTAPVTTMALVPAAAVTVLDPAVTPTAYTTSSAPTVVSAPAAPLYVAPVVFTRSVLVLP